MERKVSRRGPHPDHLHLDKSMISGPTNFSHVGRSDPFRDRLGEWAEGETQVGGGVKDHRWAEVSEEERQEREGEGEQGGEYDPCPVSPPSPNTERRSSRRISKDMISLPMNFRHVLHIDPSSADPEHLSLLLKSGTEMEYDLECDEEEEEEEEEEEQQEEEEEEENENEDPAWPPPEPPVDYHEGTKGAPDPAPAKPRALRPSNRVRGKSHVTLGGPDPDQDPDGVRFHGGDSNFDFNIVQFRVPPPPPFQFCGNDVSRSSLPSRPRAHHQHLIEEEARRERRNDSMEEGRRGGGGGVAA
ncbi:uncharacterized protein LOC123512644 isoform X3 [Portunus trituberculatus]|uniref:uncharacterized protein LOC123512644 isoform X3 n=1 Tax=Portunus trituberculatus TaxID=210409 RepID=UPI001E1CBA67|nr:uncharacterized protein LOC123512644 isoform X3 [Portunus trituberculatus]